MNQFILYASIALGLILIFLLIQSRTLKDILRIRRTPTYWASALIQAEGQVEVAGKASKGNAKSPITQTSCVLWEVEVEEHRQTGRSSRWVTVYKGASSEPFEIQDETGSIQVLPSKDSRLILNDDARQSTGVFKSTDPGIISAVENLGIKTTGWLGIKKSLRIHERYVLPDDQIYVLGELQNYDGRKAISGGAGDPLLVSDRSESELLRTLYWRIGIPVVLILAGIIGLVIFFSFIGRTK